MYVNGLQPSHGDIMVMTSDTWELVDFSLLRINHALIKTSVAQTKPTVKAHTITTTKIEVADFMKYCSVSLHNKTQIINFYDNFVTQATGYHIFIRPSTNITPLDGVIPDNMQSDCISMIAATIYAKLSQDDTIVIEYTDAHNILATTTSGFEFLHPPPAGPPSPRYQKHSYNQHTKILFVQKPISLCQRDQILCR